MNKSLDEVSAVLFEKITIFSVKLYMKFILAQ